MKINKYLLLLLTTCIISCRDRDGFNVDCLPAGLQSGVIAFYPFYNGSLDDASSNSNNITNSTIASPTTDRNGNANCAYQFNNAQSDEAFLTTSNTGFLDDLNEFSVSIWYFPMDTTRPGGKLEVLLCRGDGLKCPDRIGEWSVGLFDCRRAVFGHHNSVWANTVTGFVNGCEGEIAALSNKWHHVVATKKDNEYKIYLDGSLEESASGNAECTNLYVVKDIGDMFIGRNYTGKIDDIIIYDRALSAAEVLELFTASPCCN